MEDISPEAQEIFPAIEWFYNLDFIPQYYRLLSRKNGRLRKALTIEKERYEEQALADGRTAAVIGLSVAMTRNSLYWINWHMTSLRAMGMSTHEINGVVELVGQFNEESAFALGTGLSPDVTSALAGRMAESPAMRSARRRWGRSV